MRERAYEWSAARKRYCAIAKAGPPDRLPGWFPAAHIVRRYFYAARTLTAALLTKMGCEVDAVEHGEHALLHASEHAYDLILLDIEMPVMDGVCAARKIRELGGAPSHVPIMALSAFLADTAKAASIRGEFDLALAKPAGRDALQAAIQTMLDNGGTAASHAE